MTENSALIDPRNVSGAPIEEAEEDHTYFCKYTEIEAVLYSPDEENREQVLEFGGDDVNYDEETNTIWVHTANGDVILSPGHWLARGNVDAYPIDPASFSARWQKKMSGVRVQQDRLLSSTDAEVWAEEFVTVVKQRPSIAVDEHTMTQWFGNCMRTAIAVIEQQRLTEAAVGNSLTQE